MNAEILTPESSQWDDFVDRLGAAIAIAQDCCSLRYAERILVEIRNINVPAIGVSFGLLANEHPARFFVPFFCRRKEFELL